VPHEYLPQLAARKIKKSGQASAPSLILSDNFLSPRKPQLCHCARSLSPSKLAELNGALKMALDLP
jgi:hypothetical protein